MNSTKASQGSGWASSARGRTRRAARSGRRRAPRSGRPWSGSGGRRCRRRPRRALGDVVHLRVEALVGHQLAGGVEHRARGCGARRRAGAGRRADGVGLADRGSSASGTQTESRFRIVAIRNRNSASDYTHDQRPTTDRRSTDDRRHRNSKSKRWIALALLCMAQFVVVLDASIVNVALPTIGESLDFSARTTSPGSSTPTSSPSAASCCWAAASPTCSAAAASSWPG